MSSQQPWIERRFEFDTAVELYPQLIERLRETPARLEEVVASVAGGLLVRRHEDSWSIQENVGHLGDLEDLMAGRLDDFQAGAEELRPADMSNQATRLAGHNEKKIEDLLRRFRDRREAYVARLESLSPDDFARSAHHRRLGVQMRLIDQLFFQAEHDDHHLARIRQLSRGL
jgi:hypothetical protein